jgi:hypothetical protein
VQKVTLSNTGNAALSVTSIRVTGANAGDFAQTNTCGSSVAASADCSISVTFKPTATGARNAAIGIADNASGSPQSITLSGTGSTPPTPTPTGTYPVVVKAVSGSDSHSITVNVVVH